MRLALFGCGHIGLVTASSLAELGHQVCCTDGDAATIGQLSAGRLPIFEPRLDEIVARNSQAGRLRFTTDVAAAVAHGEVIFICTDAPVLESGDADLSAVDKTARSVAEQARGNKLVVVRSTVPVETGQYLNTLLAAYRRDSPVQFTVACNPSFLREGNAVEDFFHPDRILLGADQPAAAAQLQEIYRPILDQDFSCPLHRSACPRRAPRLLVTSVKSAELIKQAANAFLAVKISYANTLADLCEKLEADVEEVTRAVGLDQRIGSQFLQVGLGFGGFRLPNDVRALIRLAERAGMDLGLMREAERVNRQHIAHFLNRIQQALWVIRDKRIAVLGLAYKAHTDDLRGSPAAFLVEKLLEAGAHVRGFDPQAMPNARAQLPRIELAPDAHAAAVGADALVIGADWPEFRHLDWERIGEAMARPLVFDGRNLLDPATMKGLGFEYHSIGRPS